MNKVLKNTILIFITIMIFGCEKDEIVKNQVTTINFDINKSNSDNNYSTTVDEIINTPEKISRFHYGVDSVELIKEIQFNIKLKNRDSINLGFWFIAYESPTLLNLGEFDSIYLNGLNWDYINFEDEINNFYKGFKEARVIVNNSNVIFYNSPQKSFFQIDKAEQIFINGEYKTYIEIKFEGTAFGFYDPQGIYQEVYKIDNGIFKGIIE